MNEETMRLQCMQTANQMLGMYTMPGQEPKHTPDEVLALANKLYQFCKTGTL